MYQKPAGRASFKALSKTHAIKITALEPGETIVITDNYWHIVPVTKAE